MATPTTLTPYILHRLNRRRARKTYWAAYKQEQQIHNALRYASCPRERARMLDMAAGHQSQMAATHAVGFNSRNAVNYIPQVRRNASELLHLLARVEDAIDAGDTTGALLPRDTRIADAAHPVLLQMVRQPERRAVLLEDLHEVVLAVAGFHTAEIVAELPSPGYLGWMTDEELADWPFYPLGYVMTVVRYVVLRARGRV